DQIADTAPVTVFQPLDLNGFSETIGALTLSGLITTGAGTLTLNGDVTAQTVSPVVVSAISGKLSLGAATRTFTVLDYSLTDVDLDVPAARSGSGGIVKQGAGTFLMPGANTYGGTTQVAAGVLRIQHNTALGSAASKSGTTVASGAALEVAGGISSAEPLFLN